MSEQKTVKYDIDGYEAVTAALRELINQYSAWSEGIKGGEIRLHPAS